MDHYAVLVLHRRNVAATVKRCTGTRRREDPANALGFLKVQYAYSDNIIRDSDYPPQFALVLARCTG